MTESPAPQVPSLRGVPRRSNPGRLAARHDGVRAIALLAVDYAHQTPPVGIPGDPKRVAAGGQLYHSGNPETGVPACITCHGAGALGAPAQDPRPAAPRLAGQHRDYLDKQLTMFASNARENKTMHQNAVNLGAGQIGLLADYLAAQ